MEILFQAEVCWNWDRAANSGTYLDLIIFDRGNGPEVIRTCFIDWRNKLERGEIKVAPLPAKYHGSRMEEVIYAAEELQPLIG